MPIVKKKTLIAFDCWEDALCAGYDIIYKLTEHNPNIEIDNILLLSSEDFKKYIDTYKGDGCCCL